MEEKKPNQVVIASVSRRFPEKVEELRYDYLNKCWYFWLNGIFFGVEEDGHIHT